MLKQMAEISGTRSVAEPFHLIMLLHQNSLTKFVKLSAKRWMAGATATVRGSPPGPRALPRPPGRPQCSPPSSPTSQVGLLLLLLPREHRLPAPLLGGPAAPGHVSLGCAGTGLGSSALLGSVRAGGDGGKAGGSRDGDGETQLSCVGTDERTDLLERDKVLPVSGSDGRDCLRFSPQKPGLDGQCCVGTSAPAAAARAGGFADCERQQGRLRLSSWLLCGEEEMVTAAKGVCRLRCFAQPAAH